MTDGIECVLDSKRVLDFNGAFRKKRIEPVWEHSCGGQTYYLHENGEIECARCHEFLSKVWGEQDDKDRLSIALAANHDLRTERDDLTDRLMSVTKELDEASPMTRCDCCGSSFRLHKMVIEEGDRWECYPCWEALNAKEGK